MRRMLAGILFAPLLVACASDQTTGQVESARVLYEQGQYDGAYEAAAPVARGGGRDAAEAAYVAGLAAYKMGRADEAESLFTEATRASSRETAGNAYAMRGTIRQQSRRAREAADDFQAAADRLEGEQGARAAYEAGLALRSAGDPVAARSMLVEAASRSEGDVRRDAERELAATGWTLQVGAFRDRANAEQMLERVRPTAVQRGLVPARIATSREAGGATIYTVCVGSFSSRRAAESARAELGRLDAWAVPLSARD